MAKPTIRFRGFDYEWEQRKFGEITELKSASRVHKDEWTSNGVPFYRSSDVMAAINGTENEKAFISEELYEKLSKVSGKLEEGDILVTGGGSVGNPYIVPDNKPLYTKDADLLWIKNKGKFHPYFLYEFFFSPTFRNYLESISHVGTIAHYTITQLSDTPICLPSFDEQKEVGEYFQSLDNLITLHQRKCDETKKLKKYMLQKMFPQNGSKVPEIRFKGFTDEWEQRKFGEIVEKYEDPIETPTEGYTRLGIRSHAKGTFHSYVEKGKELETAKMFRVAADKFIVNITFGWEHAVAITDENDAGKLVSHRFPQYSFNAGMNPNFFRYLILDENFKHHLELSSPGGAGRNRVLKLSDMLEYKMNFPSEAEQKKIAAYFDDLDNLITLHQRKPPFTRILRKYTKITKETTQMSELERILEEKLIEQLVYGDSQWTYRKDLKTEEDLWENFKYILEQNNKDRLNGEPLSDTEFEQVKNQLQFSSFYKAGEWLVGENGKVQVHVQRDTERLHLVVMNHEHIAGGSSVYEVINQYEALKSDEDAGISERDRRFDVTLLINGLPMIHIELKNKQHSYMEAFRQIKKYIGEGKFTGIFSAVQMFVVSNGVDTRYFAAASDTELNEKFMSGWVDRENKPVSDYLDFAKSVLRIPEAHEMIARYTVLDKDAKRLILLRPYQIHAIESIREASKTTKSGYVWHTTGSGKTLTSYKATRNLLMDIPSIDKAIFLIDRRDLDTQTTMAFQAYANNDSIDVDETSNVTDLKNKLKSGDRQVIVTTIQKLQILISKRITEDTPEYRKIKNLKIAFVVDECHRAVTPKTKRELEHFFGRSLWYGFTGTPRFPENPYPQLGDLPRTTKDLYGECLHKYTIQNAIHDNAVLGFQVEHNGPKQITDETDTSAYDNEAHMLKVLDVILNKSYYKLGFQNGKGETYEGLLTTSSIQLAQKYYDLLLRVKKGETSLKIDERIRQVLPDFPKFAITYSVTENEEGSHVNQQKMQRSLDEYNRMFGTKYELSQIQSYNGNLNKRLARKDAKFKSRNEQLDLVIVVDRLLTGFDAPCLSTIFIDRQPMGPHDLIQAFSRTNRIFNRNKTYGQIVTFQAPKLFRKSVDDAVKLYSAGSTGSTFVADWEEVEPAFRKALAALRISAETPDEIADMSLKEKKVFVKIFQNFDRLFAQLKSFTKYEDSMLEEYCITQKEYEDYAGYYQNAMEEIRIANGDGKDQPGDDETQPADLDYELMAYSNTKIDYEYIINLIQNIVTPDEDSEDSSPEERQKRIDEVKQYVCELQKTNSKVAKIMTDLIYEIEMDDRKFRGKSILNIMEKMKYDCIDKAVSDFCTTWYASKEDVMYAAMHYRNGKIPNESVIKDTINYAGYKAAQEKPLPKFKYNRRCIEELGKILDEEIKPLINIA